MKYGILHNFDAVHGEYFFGYRYAMQTATIVFRGGGKKRP